MQRYCALVELGVEEGRSVRAADVVARLDDVHLSFAGVKAVNGVSFEVRPGELFAIIGPNGAGKTSLFNVLSGVYRPQQGEIVLRGDPAARVADRIAQRLIGRG